MSKYEKELQTLKSHDEIQGISEYKKGYNFITTAGHGYLVIPSDDINYKIAKKIVEYGYVGRLAIYLEEDCEVGEFMQELTDFDRDFV